MLELKAFGILPLLDEECRMPIPKTESFLKKIISKHGNCNAFSLSSSNKTASGSIQNDQYGFAFRHFGKEVVYSTVRIMENVIFAKLE